MRLRLDTYPPLFVGGVLSLYGLVYGLMCRTFYVVRLIIGLLGRDIPVYLEARASLEPF